MSTDIRLAFEHPEMRAAATAGANSLDRISLRDYTVEVEIGAFQAERGTKQRVCFNVVVEVRPVTEPFGDDVDRILSYDTITQSIDDALSEERLNLLETLAARIADRILAEPAAERVFVRIEKLDRGPGALGVEIVRDKPKTPLHPTKEQAEHVEAPQPRVLFFDNVAIVSDHLPGWIDQVETSGVPTIICVGPPDNKQPSAEADAVQRRINLLAIEQNAWVLAGRDKRCVVIETRTELEWAVRNGHLAVWAPSKMVLDSQEGRFAVSDDTSQLIQWFSEQVNACDVLVVGDPMEIGGDIPVNQVSASTKQIL